MFPHVNLSILSFVESTLLPLHRDLYDVPGQDDPQTMSCCCIIVTPAPPSAGHLVGQVPVVGVYSSPRIGQEISTHLNTAQSGVVLTCQVQILLDQAQAV